MHTNLSILSPKFLDILAVSFFSLSWVFLSMVSQGPERKKEILRPIANAFSKTATALSTTAQLLALTKFPQPADFFKFNF